MVGKALLEGPFGRQRMNLRPPRRYDGIEAMIEPDSTRTDASEEGLFRHSQVTVGNSLMHVVECGSPQASLILFLHGWPESWEGWRSVMRLAGNSHRAIAIDLPGVGGSICDGSDGTKRQMVSTIHELIVKMGLKDIVPVGQDVGGMVVYSICACSTTYHVP